MENKEYIEKAKRTELKDYKVVSDRIGKRMSRLLHGSMGVSTEAGELLDILKKTLMYGKRLDVVNLKEELGDLLWYVAILCDELGVSLESLHETNIKKLIIRYPEKFTESNAENRNLEDERSSLEKED